MKEVLHEQNEKKMMQFSIDTFIFIQLKDSVNSDSYIEMVVNVKVNSTGDGAWAFKEEEEEKEKN